MRNLLGIAQFAWRAPFAAGVIVALHSRHCDHGTVIMHWADPFCCDPLRRALELGTLAIASIFL